MDKKLLRISNEMSDIGGFFIGVIFLIIALWQGGFSDTATLVCGAGAAAYMLLKGKKLPPPPVTVLFAVFIAAYITAAAINGGRLEGFIGATKPAAAFLWLCVFYNVKPDVEKTVFASGIVLSALGILTYCGLPPLDGAVKAGRLQGSFQYANAFALYIGACALLTRLSPEPKRSKYACFMEIALFLTNSIGGMAVYAGGMAVIYIKEIREKRKDYQDMSARLPQILMSAVAAGLMIALFRFVSPYAAILPAIAMLFIINPMQRLTGRGLSPRVAASLFVGAVVVLFAAAGTRPFATYIERLIQISDGFRTILGNPFGIGAGAWGLEFQARQSAFYDAVVLHSSFTAIGVAAGFPALLCALGLAWYAVKTAYSKEEIAKPLGKRSTRPHLLEKCGRDARVPSKTEGFAISSKYKVAICMIVVHSMFDFSLSFFAVTALLCLLSAQAIQGGIPLPGSFKAAFILPIAVCVALLVPAAIKNRATWAANSGRYAEAMNLLRAGFLKRDTEAAMLRLRAAVSADLFADFDAAFDSLRKPNAEAYSLAAQTFMRRGQFDDAAKMAELCAVNSPYSAGGYKLAESVMEFLPESRRKGCADRLRRLKADALKNINPLARFLPEDERAAR